MAHKKVSYTPRAPINNWNIKFCMQNNCPGSSFSATYHKSNTGVSKPHHHIRLTNGFREDVKMWQIFLKDWNGTSLFLNSFWEHSTNLSLYTDASGTLGFGGIFRTQWFQGKWLPHQTLTTKKYQH